MYMCLCVFCIGHNEYIGGGDHGKVLARAGQAQALARRLRGRPGLRPRPRPGTPAWPAPGPAGPAWAGLGRARPARPRQGPWGTLWGPIWDDFLANFPPVPGHFLGPSWIPQRPTWAPPEKSKRQAFGVAWGAFPGG